MKRGKLRYCFGQSTAEYAVLVALVAAAIIAMQVYLKRGLQGRIRDLADQISPVHYERGGIESISIVSQKGTTVQKSDSGKSSTTQNETITRSSNETVYPE